MTNLLTALDSIFQVFYKLPLPDPFRVETINKFAEILNDQTLLSNLTLACNRVKGDPDGTLKYFCSVCWSDIKVVNKAKSLVR